jgi:hypothetical protein
VHERKVFGLWPLDFDFLSADTLDFNRIFGQNVKDQRSKSKDQCFISSA